MFLRSLAPCLASSLALAVALTIATGGTAARAFETGARQALVIDDATGMVLFAKNADQPLPPASMSKLMTLYMLFEALRDGRVTMDDRVHRQPRRPRRWRARGCSSRPATTVPVERADPRHHRPVGQRRLRRGRRGPRRHRGDLRRSDDPARPRARHDRARRSATPPAGPRTATHERARPRHAGAAHHRGLPRVLRDLRRDASSPGTASPSRTATRCSSSGSAPTGSRPATPPRRATASSARRCRTTSAWSSWSAASTASSARADEIRRDREMGLRRLRDGEASSTPASRSHQAEVWLGARRRVPLVSPRADPDARPAQGARGDLDARVVYDGPGRGADRRRPGARRADRRGAPAWSPRASSSSPRRTCRAAACGVRVDTAGQVALDRALAADPRPRLSAGGRPPLRQLRGHRRLGQVHAAPPPGRHACAPRAARSS